MGMDYLVYDDVSTGRLVHSVSNGRLIYGTWWSPPVRHFYNRTGRYIDPTNYRSKPEAEWAGKSDVWPLAKTNIESKSWGVTTSYYPPSWSYWYIYDNPTIVQVSCQLSQSALRLQTSTYRGRTLDVAVIPGIIVNSYTTPPSGTIRLSAYASDTSTPTDTTSSYSVSISASGDYTIPCSFALLDYLYIMLEIVDCEPPDQAKRNTPPSSAEVNMTFNAYTTFARLRIP